MPYSIGFQLDGMSGPGSGTWTRLSTLVNALSASGNEVHLWGEVGKHDSATEFGATSVVLRPPQSAAQRVFNRMHSLEKFAKQSGLDVIHLEAPPFIGSRSTPTIAAIHDTRHFSQFQAQTSSFSSLYQKYVVGRFAPNIAAWLTLSNFAKVEICQNLSLENNKVYIVPPIVNRGSTRPTYDFTKFGVTGEFVLILGHLEPRKNAETVLRATFCPEWPPSLGLVIAGRDHGSLSSLRIIAQQSPAQVWFVDSPNEDEKWGLLENALVVLIPSLVEGFGIVAVEAALAKTAYMVSEATATVELAGEPSAAISPLDPVAWARGVASLHESRERRARLRRAQDSLLEQFSPESVVPRLTRLYGELLSDG